MKKNKSVAILAVVLAVVVALGYYASIILSSTGKGAGQNITLGLDLAGGVSITYQVEDEDATAEQMSDTIYKLQRRIESYSTEATVYQSGDDRICIEIPGVTDANDILEDATINSKDENTVNTVLDIVKNNVETEDLNFSDFLN